MAEVLIPADPVTLALPYLRTALPGEEIHARVPATKPARLVVLRRAGRTRSLHNILTRPRIDAQVWALTDFDALELADEVEAHLLAAPGLVDGVSDATVFLGPTVVPDPDDETPRVLLTVEWQIKASPVVS